MKRFPVVATISVGLAIVAMIALGFWQLQRRAEKEALLAHLAANQHLVPIAFPAIPVGDDLLFRRASVMCLKPVAWQSRGGRDAAGNPGWREIASCSTGAEGPGVTVQVGIASTANAKPTWAGGKVSGYISHAPSDVPMIAALFSHAPRPLMLVADPPLAGLAANPPADLSSVPNNHLAYAVQWFLFALVAGVIYAIALRRRMRGQP